MAIIINGADQGFFSGGAGLPQMGETLLTWLQPTVFSRVTKSVVNFEVSEVATDTSFSAVIQPFSAEDLMLKEEGERSWKWFTLHALPGVILNPDDVIRYRTQQYRVMGKLDYQDYGYIEYQCIEDYTDSGPTEAMG